MSEAHATPLPAPREEANPPHHPQKENPKEAKKPSEEESCVEGSEEDASTPSTSGFQAG